MYEVNRSVFLLIPKSNIVKFDLVLDQMKKLVLELTSLMQKILTLILLTLLMVAH